MSGREEGFSLVEVLVALSIGLVMVLAAFQALDAFVAQSATTQRRSDNVQKARQAMDGLVRAMRSAACDKPGGTSLLASSTGASIQFITDLGNGMTPPEKRIVTWDAASRTLSESRFAAGSLAGTSLTFASTPTGYGAQLADVEPTVAGGPVFTYFGYDAGNPPRPTVAYPTPLNDANAKRVARIAVAFRVGPASGQRDARTATVLSDEVFLRAADPADPVPLPLCP